MGEKETAIMGEYGRAELISGQDIDKYLTNIRYYIQLINYLMLIYDVLVQGKIHCQH